MRISDWSSDVCSSDLNGNPDDPRRRDSRSQNWTSSASVNGMLGDWRWSVTGNYADADQRTFTEQESGARDRFDSSQQSFGTKANISGTVVEGWAGPIRSSITGGYSGQRFDSRTERGDDLTTTELRSEEHTYELPSLMRISYD